MNVFQASTADEVYDAAVRYFRMLEPSDDEVDYLIDHILSAASQVREERGNG